MRIHAGYASVCNPTLRLHCGRLSCIAFTSPRIVFWRPVANSGLIPRACVSCQPEALGQIALHVLPLGLPVARFLKKGLNLSCRIPRREVAATQSTEHCASQLRIRQK